MLIASVITIAGCKGKEQSAERAQATGQQGMGSMKMDSMPMGGGQMGMAGSNMMSMMRAHMDSKELATRMEAHAERVRRLIAMHEGMMKGT